MKAYRVSFTGANAMVQEFVKLAALIVDGIDLQDIEVDFLKRDKLATNKREFRELKHRMATLTPQQIEILTSGSLTAQKQITHLALAKTYPIYKELTVEVLNEKIRVYDYTLTELDYNAFISRKTLEHPELEKLTLNTQKKIKQVLFRMLAQVGLINSSKDPVIQIPQLDKQIEHSIIEEDPALLACFLYDEYRIQSLA